MDEANIEDLAFGIRSSREPGSVGRRVCLSWVVLMSQCSGLHMSNICVGNKNASYAAAEESEWRMALKI
ncbi:hypothetical protein E3J48_04400 [Candidatus Aerophobetes bacterium]|uniref:Uncharacterized protein n=1 Tax=Aerophobetes bacterium TaxID=2030807 RepID=A0A523W663_UNCAE|nr:MAG: hypothetical protein E3J48_04400 [Candidatus Aerophobetes bacterium]